MKKGASRALLTHRGVDSALEVKQVVTFSNPSHASNHNNIKLLHFAKNLVNLPGGVSGNSCRVIRT